MLVHHKTESDGNETKRLMYACNECILDRVEIIILV